MAKKPHHENELNQGEDQTNEASYEALLKELEETKQKSDQHWERLLRMQADTDNAARRAERDIANAHKYALEKFVNELLPIVDSLELCVNSSPEDKSSQAVVEGVNLTLKMFYTALEKFGVKQVNPVSEPFDPEHQQAISMQPDPKVPAGTVISVLQKGYTLNNRLIRPALVVVSESQK